MSREAYTFSTNNLSADGVIFSFVFVYFYSFFTKIFFHIMFLSADVVVATVKLAKIIGIFHFNIEMLKYLGNKRLIRHSLFFEEVKSLEIIFLRMSEKGPTNHNAFLTIFVRLKLRSEVPYLNRI